MSAYTYMWITALHTRDIHCLFRLEKVGLFIFYTESSDVLADFSTPFKGQEFW